MKLRMQKQGAHARAISRGTRIVSVLTQLCASFACLPRRVKALVLGVVVVCIVIAMLVANSVVATKDIRCSAWASSQDLSIVEGTFAANELNTISLDANTPIDSVVGGAGFNSDLDAASGFVSSTREVEEFLQYPAGLYAGCEPVSLTLALRSFGFDISPEQLIETYMPIDYTWTDWECYMGSPYDQGGSFPPGMVNTANNFFEAENVSMQAVNLSGASFEELQDLVADNVPVLIWTTMYGAEPVFDGVYVGDYAWYINEHCVLLYGVEGDQALISDPLEGLITRDLNDFAQLYNACGSMAVSFEYIG